MCLRESERECVSIYACVSACLAARTDLPDSCTTIIPSPQLQSCRAAQDTVRLFEEQDKGVSPGLALVLNHCNVDSRNPFLREWALLCVRHLCEGNTANQAAIARLEAQAAVQTEGLRAVGVKATLGENGRVGVRRMGKEE